MGEVIGSWKGNNVPNRVEGHPMCLMVKLGLKMLVLPRMDVTVCYKIYRL